MHDSFHLAFEGAADLPARCGRGIGHADENPQGEAPLAIEAVQSRSQGLEVDASHQAGPQQQVDSTGLEGRLGDLHVHLLWGLDDGPRTAEESLALCRALVDEGVGFAAATCHQRGTFTRNSTEIILARAEELAALLGRERIPLEVRPSAEWMLDAQTAERLTELLPGLVTLLHQRKFALIEFPFQLPSYLPMVAQVLRDHGLVGVIAHLEKYHQLLENSTRVEAVVREGFLMQMNADSVAGKFGPGVMNSCRRLIQRGLVHLIASDAHSADRRPPLLRQARENVVRWTSESTAELLFQTNPRALWNGEEARLPQAMSWLARFRRRH
jgi:protein-tyrosine phosphatase